MPVLIIRDEMTEDESIIEWMVRTRQLIWEACEQHWESGDFAVQSLIQLYKETTKDGESNALPRFG